MTRRLPLLALAIGSLAIAACGSGGKSSSSTAPTAANTTASSSSASSNPYSHSTAATTTTASNTGGSGTNQVVMKDYFFSPSTIKGKAGTTVTIHLRNDGQAEHNFKIDSQKQADADVKPGQTAEVKVKIPASGTVPFYCEYHKGLGMVGTVHVAG